MITILIDHNIEGQAQLLAGTMLSEGWLDLFTVRLVTFREAGVPIRSNDRLVWRFAQQHEMLLLTDNRPMTGTDSLEQTLREDNTDESLPILTIGDADKMVDSGNRALCAARLFEIVIELDNYRGVGRLFIP